ncbi:hypothetical protein OO25_07600 [Phaeobacter sp. S60]|nr:hypothetical protein OO25_07600 [Phaeobacter sp. S60]
MQEFNSFFGSTLGAIEVPVGVTAFVSWVLHIMLVAGSALNTKGRCRNFPLPFVHSSRGKIQAPCPSSLRCAFGVFKVGAPAL